MLLNKKLLGGFPANYYMQINALLASIYVLWQGVLFPYVWDNNYYIISFGKYFILLALLIINYRKMFNYDVFSFIVVYLFIICLKFIFSSGNVLALESQWGKWLSLVLNGISMLIVFSVPFQLECFINYATKVSILACLVMCGCIADNDMFDFVASHIGWYMIFGFLLMVPLNIILVYIFLYGTKKIWYIFIYFMAVCFLGIYGNRGALLVHLILLFVLIYNKFNCFRHVLLLGGGMALIFFKDVLQYLSILLTESGYDNSNSIIINKLIKFYHEGDMNSFSSGRLDIWEYAWNHFLDNAMFGDDLGFIYAISTSCHNVLLEILSTYGIFIFAFFVIYIIFHLFYSWISADDYNRVCIYLFISFAFPSLTSGEIFLDTGFMAMLGILLSKKCIKHRKIITFEE